MTQPDTAAEPTLDLSLSWFNTQLAELGVTPGLTDSQYEQFNTLYNTLVETNKTMNLTRISQPSDVYVGHFLDSLTLLGFVASTQDTPLTLMDIGSGAGFPALALAIVRPAWQVVAIESIQKKAGFIEATAKQLGLDNVTVLAQRAEAVGQDKTYREQADIVTARAVSRVGVLSELGLPLLKPGGSLWLYKTRDKATDECQQARKVIPLLGGDNPVQHDLPSPWFTQRCLVNITKRTSTPAMYPRRDGLPEKKPL